MEKEKKYSDFVQWVDEYGKCTIMYKLQGDKRQTTATHNEREMHFQISCWIVVVE